MAEDSFEREKDENEREDILNKVIDEEKELDEKKEVKSDLDENLKNLAKFPKRDKYDKMIKREGVYSVTPSMDFAGGVMDTGKVKGYYYDSKTS